MTSFTKYLPPHRPLCLCIGHDAPELGEQNLRVTDIAGMLPLLRDTGAMFDLVSIVIDSHHLVLTNIFEQIFAPKDDALAELLNTFVTFVTQRGNLVVFADANWNLSLPMNEKMWLKLPSNKSQWMLCFSHQHTGYYSMTPSADAWLTHRKGPVVDKMTACTDSEHRFIAATLEYQDRRNPGACEIDFKHPSLLTCLPPYHRYKAGIPNQHKHWMSLFRNRNLADIMAKPHDRAILRAIVQSKDWRISPDALAAIQAAFATHAARHAPLNEQTEAQRLAWLDECTSVKTRDNTDHALAAAFKSREYPITTALLETSTPSQRPGSDGESEDITHHGTALAVRVIDDLGTEHTFTALPPGTSPHATTHTWQDFLAIFHPPEVPDIATLRPDDYAARRHWLVQFAASLSTEPA